MSSVSGIGGGSSTRTSRSETRHHNNGRRPRSSSVMSGDEGDDESERYTMHPLQTTYVRSTARQRLDLMKTLAARREAALDVVAKNAAAARGGAAIPGERRPGSYLFIFSFAIVCCYRQILGVIMEWYAGSRVL